ncbi:serine/threonine-protein kinase [Planosporangium sp. 12N6]|uniref:serine/threonine-protein kinase n=1 Tax=Planosporangium spinosum TaxID=3402278 RepID=UPI003CF82239
MAWLPVGITIRGRYTVMGAIGHGGVAVVYRAMDACRGEMVAVKMLAPTFAADPHARDRVRLEAMIADALRHPCVPRVYDVGDAPLPDGSTVPYLAMELFSGIALARRLAHGPLPWREAVATAARVADVLAVAHRRGIVHRDLTPANIVLTPAGPKIVDFGVAIRVGRDGAGGVRAGHADAPPVACADDVYALGMLLYRMLTGHSPYPGLGAALSMRLRQVAPTPVLLVAGLPRQVAEICRDCMAKRPADRPTASAAALALWAVLDDVVIF